MTLRKEQTYYTPINSLSKRERVYKTVGVLSRYHLRNPVFGTGKHQTQRLARFWVRIKRQTAVTV